MEIIPKSLVIFLFKIVFKNYLLLPEQQPLFLLLHFVVLQGAGSLHLFKSDLL